MINYRIEMKFEMELDSVNDAFEQVFKYIP